MWLGPLQALDFEDFTLKVGLGVVVLICLPFSTPFILQRWRGSISIFFLVFIFSDLTLDFLQLGYCHLFGEMGQKNMSPTFYEMHRVTEHNLLTSPLVSKQFFQCSSSLKSWWTASLHLSPFAQSLWMSRAICNFRALWRSKAFMLVSCLNPLEELWQGCSESSSRVYVSSFLFWHATQKVLRDVPKLCLAYKILT